MQGAGGVVDVLVVVLVPPPAATAQVKGEDAAEGGEEGHGGAWVEPLRVVDDVRPHD